MKNLRVNPRVLIIVYFLMLAFFSCNNEELFVVKESTLLTEEVEETEETEETEEGEGEGDTEDTDDTEITDLIFNIVDDVFETSEDTAIELDLLSNDESLVSGLLITYTNPVNGTLGVNDNNTPEDILDDTIIYTPNPGFSGTDSFEYTICNAANPENCGSAVVAIVVNAFVEIDNTNGVTAFPGATGAGAYTTGGRRTGTKVYHITTLEDPESGDGEPGTLRHALKAKGPRIIVFDVSGTIRLRSETLKVSREQDAYITILGQTAPKGGISITNGQFFWEYTHDAIIRYLKFRNGHTSGRGDCISFVRSWEGIIDHCSASYAVDEAFAFSGNPNSPYETNITVSNNLVGESKTGFITSSKDPNPDYSQGITMYRNATANVGWRFPKLGGNTKIDVVNNFIHNWRYRTIRCDAGNYRFNHINNYYQDGSSSDKNKLAKTYTDDSSMDPRIYTAGNYVSAGARPSGFDADNTLGWAKFVGGGAQADPKSEWFVSSPLPFSGAAPVIMNADATLKASIVADVGSCKYIKDDGTVGFYRDALDLDYVNLIENDIIRSPLDDEDYGDLASDLPPEGVVMNERPENFYNLDPHVPDVWFTANVPSGKTSLDINPNTGRLYLEDYANQVDQ